MSFEWSARRMGILFVASVALAACTGSSRAQTAAQPRLAANHSAADPASSCSPGIAQLPDFSGLVEKYGPAVVNVQVVEHAQSGGDSSGSGDDSDDPFNEFFRRFGIPAPNTPRNLPPQKGTGSGFIVSPDGYILTNAHVVSNADEVTVKLIDRREYRAKVIGIDERTDVAVIKIDGHALPVVKIGDASKLKPGQWVVAIGSPFDFDNSATAGIVSATARPLQSEPTNYVSFIQTDVPINPGNSGGPLFNVKGEVVGINSQIFSQTGGYMGLSFAIPIDVAVNVEEQIIRLGHVVRGRIGVLIQDVNAQLAESFGLDRPRGALVSSVEPGGPADKAGIKPGDVILAVNGQTIERYGELSSRISNTKPGSDVRLSIWRNRSQEQLNVHVALLNEREERTASRAQPGRGSDEAVRLGLSVRALTADEKQQAQTDGNLIVERASGPAAAAGVEPGDVILGVNGKPVRSLSELDQATRSAGKTFALRIQRQDQQLYLPLQLP
ncbi:MAG TPA: DegQ family serine endoprotease [Steroidobacteraceae bacterium]|nr:DegQ family serine endoprotease [Steroidobacteraceae bacterium]